MNKRFFQPIAILLTFVTIVLVMPPAVMVSDMGELPPGFVKPTPETPPDNNPQTQPPTDPVNTTDPTDDPGEGPGTEPLPTPDPVVTITISAAGDVTLGGDASWGSYQNFMNEFIANDRDFGFPFRNVKHIFEEDDLTIVNFEGTLTNSSQTREKRFNFRAPPEFAASLVLGNINVVSLANNHSGDFLDAGYRDTIEHLDNAGIYSFGYDRNTIIEVKGINIGLFGFNYVLDNTSEQKRKDDIAAAIEDLRNRGAQLIIAYFHWGEENRYKPNSIQRDHGRFTLDSGADLVLGAHPHVIQGIEEYNGRNIVYSLANFSFGGNRWPPDYDTFIFQQTFTFVNGVLQEDNVTNIIPARESSARNHNNYQPTIAEGQEATRILAEIQRLSNELN